MLHLSPPVLVLDLETTTDDREKAGIIEFGAICFHEPEASAMAFELKCRPYPGAPISPGAIEVNGCDWLEDESLASEAFAVFVFDQWLQRAYAGVPGKIMIAGMNPGFDWHILKNAWARAREFGDWRVRPFPFTHRTLDLHSLAVASAVSRGIHVPAGGFTSKQICTLFGYPPEAAPHRALTGALWEWRLLQGLLVAPVNHVPVFPAVPELN